MLALAGEIADGALPAGLPPEHTARARQLLGPDKLLVVGQSVVVDDDRDRARATARQVVSSWSGRASFRANLAEPDTIAAKVRAHLAAGADHVTLLQPIGTELAPGIYAVPSGRRLIFICPHKQCMITRRPASIHADTPARCSQ
jgi:alkanesulfonate monooxygenase SsuD/methylene tetrahydromethanopterin reductase-like flavin-dependent oxidoreductase (luciferase family)